MKRAAPVGGILLTGGASRRMGFDKALMRVDGAPNAARLAQLLVGATAPTIEVGPGFSGLPSVFESPAGSGPLVATCAGALELRRQGHTASVIVLACDLPFVTGEVLGALAGWPGQASVVPLANGHLQPLCARWSAPDLEVASLLVDKGERSMRALLARVRFRTVGPGDWPFPVDQRALADVDTPAALEAFGLAPEV